MLPTNHMDLIAVGKTNVRKEKYLVMVTCNENTLKQREKPAVLQYKPNTNIHQ